MLFLLGLLFAAGGIAVIVWVKRRNPTGMEKFNSFKSMATAKTLEFFAYFVAILL
ncbi:hypothetical protein [Suttonella ornithocola]|uniref:hypothetical protein n=1 Tax=Suttonella ornithocola TaxID=279832 RepID=UPI0014720C50|nr:hypothetical protein [Suttonella ornithocola]